MQTLINFLKTIFLVDLLKGLWLTMKYTPQPAFTFQYPAERRPTAPRFRGVLRLQTEPGTGAQTCIVCDQCARACPVDCILIESAKAPAGQDFGTTSTGHKKRLEALVFDIDMAKCCYCDLCTFPCPTECLKMTTSYEDSVYNRYERIVRPK